MQGLKIYDLTKSERPRERLLTKGVASLSDTELIAILLGSGGKNNSVLNLAASILSHFGGLAGLAGVEVAQLINFKDVGVSKAATIKAACELGLRLALQTEIDTPVIKKPEDVYKIVRKDIYKAGKENLILLTLNARSKLISKNIISVGTINETLVHPREVYRQALINNAASIILVHNHPSGDPTPSSEDIHITERIYRAGRHIGIALLDHIIVSDTAFVSLKALGLFSTNEPHTDIKKNSIKSQHKR